MRDLDFELDSSVPHYELDASDLCDAHPVTSGSTSGVWRAGLHGQFATKVAMVPEAVEDLRAEYEILRLLSERDVRGVPRAYCFGSVRSAKYPSEVRLPAIVMQYVDGVPLDRFILGRSRQGLVDPPTAAAVTLAVADIVDDMARQGVVHRDICPNNIIMSTSGNGELYLLDFGQAVITEPGAPSSLEEDDRLATIPYGAPEMFGGDFETWRIAPTCDIWSLGAVLSSMVAGVHWPEEIEGLRDAACIGVDDLYAISESKRLPIDMVRDLKLRGTDPTKADRKAAGIVAACTSYYPDFRPSIDLVRRELQTFIFAEKTMVTPTLSPSPSHYDESLPAPQVGSHTLSIELSWERASVQNSRNNRLDRRDFRHNADTVYVMRREG